MTAALGAELTRLRQQRDQAQRHAASLVRVVELLGGELALDVLLTRIIEAVLELVEADQGVISITHGGPTDTPLEATIPVNLPLAEDGGHALGALDELVRRERRALRLDRLAALGTSDVAALAEHSVLGVPIWWRDALIGVLALAAPPPRRFSDDDLATATLFARYAAVAIAQARLLAAEQRRAARGLTISRIAQLLTSRLTLDQLLATAMDDIGQHFPEADIAIMLVDPAEPHQLVLRARRGPFYPLDRVGQYRQPIGVGIMGLAAQERRSLLIQDVDRDVRYIQGEGATGIHSELAVPLAAGDELFGVFNAEAATPLRAEDVEALTLIAEQLAIAIHNATLFDRTQRGLLEMQLLFETSQHIAMAMDVDAVVTAYLERVAARGRYICTVVLYDRDTGGLRRSVLIWGRWSPDEGLVRLSERRAPRAPDALDPLLDAGQTVTISNVQTDRRAADELRRIQAEAGRPALAMIPLMTRGQRSGLIILSAPRVQIWPEADLRPYQITAGQLAAAIDSRRQQQALADQRQHLAALEERRRLARELHDSVTQSLVSINLMAQVLPELWVLDQAEARGALNEIRDQTRGALTEMRALLVELRADDELTPDLVSALKGQIAAFERRTGLSPSVDLPAKLRLPPAVVHAVARVAQEALTNVARHAQARQVSVLLRGEPLLQLVIADDGQGFVPERVAAGRFGLISMRERVAELGGSLRLETGPGQGTRLTIDVPLAGGPPPASV